MKHKRKSREDDEESSIPPTNAKKQKPNVSEEEGQQQKPEAYKNNQTKSEKNKKKKMVNSAEMVVEEEQRKDSYLPGQIHDTPEQRDPFRIFLETLHQRLPEDELAASWMMEWGLLSYDDAKKVYEKNLAKNLPGKLESADDDVEGIKTSTLLDSNLAVSSGIASKTKRKKVRKNRLGDAISDSRSRKNKKQKIFNKNSSGDAMSDFNSRKKKKT